MLYKIHFSLITRRQGFFYNEEIRKAWIVKTAKNYIKRILTYKAKHHHVELEDDVSIAEDDTVQLDLFLDRMDDKYATVVKLYYYDDLPVKEIAKQLSITEDNVKIRLFRAREFLKNILDENGGGAAKT